MIWREKKHLTQSNNGLKTITKRRKDMGPKLQVTKNYSLFEVHELNRPIHRDKILENSMKNHGFMPSSPVQCVRNSNAKLKIIRGHHRFDIAKRLGLPIWYVIDQTNENIFDLESGRSKWSASDFAYARANDGDEDCLKLLDFMKKHNLPIGAASSLLGGESAGSHNKVEQVKIGTFHVGDLKHANQVVRITDRCRELNIPFSVSSAFVIAISLCLRIPEFDFNLFMHKIGVEGSRMRKRGTASEYMDEIEELYNYGIGSKRRLPVAFRANELSRQRHETFGRSSDKV
jgi:hypothetical protein